MEKFCFIVLLCLLLTGCNILGLNDNKNRYSYDLVYVDAIEVPDTLKLGQPLEVRVKGTMPDASWSFDHFEVKVEGFNIEIRPIGRKDHEIEVVIMILVAYDEVAKINLTKPGTYQIQVVGKEGGSRNQYGGILRASVVVVNSEPKIITNSTN